MKEDLQIKPEVLGRLRLALKGFAPATTENVHTKGECGARLKIPLGRIPLPELPYLILTAIGCANLGRSEKTAWAIPFSFEGAYCELSSEKFGLRLYLDESLAPDEATSTKTAEAIFAKLDKAQRLIESQILRPLAMDELRLGKVMVRNQYYSLRQTYQYFRQGAELAYSGDGRIKTHDHLFAKQAEGFQNTIAMVGAYFSLLEHVLVLVSPFVHRRPLGQEFLRFVGDSWSVKFKAVFDVNEDKSAKKFLDKLLRVSEEYRNTFAHGGFDKSRASIGFRIPGVGWLPAMLSDVRDSPHFSFVPTSAADYEEICQLFDELDAWLETGSSEYGLIWAKAGLDVRFDDDFQAELDQAIDNDRFEELVEETSYIVDRHMNMEF
jgi:hypothetical protein